MRQDLRAVRERCRIAQDGLCYYCRQPMWSGRDPAAFCASFRVSPRRAALFRCSAEHLTPRSAGSSDEPANIVAACCFCNRTRHLAARPRDPESYARFVQRRLAAGRWERLPLAH